MPGNLSIAALAERVKGLDGWRRRAAAFIAGIASVLALAPFFVWPVLWLTLPVLVWLIDGAVERGRRGSSGRWHARPIARAAEIGWWFGFGYFLAGLFWIGEAFLVEAEVFAVLMPLAVLLMPAGLALFYAAAAALAAPFWRTGIWRVLALALSLSAMEWTRGHVLSGFPWNVLGYALTHPISLMQSAAVFGIYGLTLIAVLVFALPPVLWSEASARWSRRIALGIALLPLLVVTAAGHIRLALATQATVPNVKIRIVQPSVPQRDKWRPENQQRIFFDHLDLSRRDATGAIDNLTGITHVVWPEAAMPFLPLDTPEALAAIGELLGDRAILITGALRAEPAPPDAPRPRTFFNSLLVFGRGGLLLTRYDKIHLVPFGEFLPMRGLLQAMGLRQLTHAVGSFDFGASPRPLLGIPGLPPTLPLICYEAIFPGALVQGAERPGLMVNVTNDGWFGNTTGPRQHLHQARVRAVEEGLPIVRAANNGVSAAFDGYGRTLGRIDLDVRGVIDISLPMGLQPPPYARFGDLVFFTIWLLGGVILGRVVQR
ncbi:MAG: apolipoprotein N-acyltransferase [Hyphomonadaceae bacterium]|nr:apolipoprotein N-acyltransferase [Hyphomonadaceae bacterium]